MPRGMTPWAQFVGLQRAVSSNSPEPFETAAPPPRAETQHRRLKPKLTSPRLEGVTGQGLYIFWSKGEAITEPPAADRRNHRARGLAVHPPATVS